MAYANVDNTAIRRSRLMSGVTLEDLALPASMDVRPTGGSCGAIVDGVDLADELPGEAIGGLLAVLCHAGILILPGQDRLTPERQAVVTEWFGRPFVRDSGVDRMATVNTTLVQILGSQAADPGSNVPAADVDRGRKLAPHSDVQDYQVTPDFTILHGVETPPPSDGSGRCRSRGGIDPVSEGPCDAGSPVVQARVDSTRRDYVGQPVCESLA